MNAIFSQLGKIGQFSTKTRDIIRLFLMNRQLNPVFAIHYVTRTIKKVKFLGSETVPLDCFSFRSQNARDDTYIISQTAC